MAMAAELASCRSPASCSPWDGAGTKLRMPAAGARRVSLGSRRGASVLVRAAGEDVGTEEKLLQSTTPYKGGRPQKKWTGYVEKDTAGQTNIYSVEPDVYVSENPFSSGSTGATATGGSTSFVQLAIGLLVVAVAGAATVLFTVEQSAPVTPEKAVGYEGPPLSFYIAKFSTQASAVAAQSAVQAPEL